ncbi:MAG: acyltransferase family protein, partial [Pseudomonadota bacterium]
MTYRADIDILRAVAVVSVVLHHAGLALPGGFIGVDIFFVISGYLITGLLWNEARSGRISLMRFYERRIRRIFPALFVMIAVSSLFAAALFLPGHLAEFGVSAAAASVFLANVHFYSATGYFSEAAQLKPLLHTWSLAVEEQFYILFPPLLLLLLRIGSGRIVAGLLAGLAAISFALSLMAMRTDPAAAFYLPHMRAWQLLVGAALAIAMADLRLATLLARAARPLRGAGALLILGGLVFLSDADPYPGWRALTPCLGAALIIAAGPAATPKLLTPAVFVGRMSYSLYLWHWPVMVFVSYRLVDPLSVVEAWACVALSFIIAAASWRWVEQPFRTASWPAPLVYRTSGRAMAVVAALGAGLYFAKGLPQRLPGDLVRLAAGEGLLHDRRDCHFVTPERAASGDVCLRGDPSARPSFVLVGDSHADAVSPGLFSAASALGLRGAQYTQSGFLPLPGVAKQGAPGRDRAAAAFV